MFRSYDHELSDDRYNGEGSTVRCRDCWWPADADKGLCDRCIRLQDRVEQERLDEEGK